MKNGLCMILVAAVLMVAGQVAAEDQTLNEIQRRLAEQESRLADMHAKLGAPKRKSNTADELVSLRKNAMVTVGGFINTKITHTTARVDSRHILDDPIDETYAIGPDYGRRAQSKTTRFEVADAKIILGVEVNDHFDAYVEIDLHNDTQEFYLAEAYYIRWKDICNSGFGLKVGRDALVFGEEGVGELGSYAANDGEALGEIGDGFAGYSGMVVNGEVWGGHIPLHNGWDVSGVTQITPYWEGLEGMLSFELSLMQNVYEDTAVAGVFSNVDGLTGYYSRPMRNGGVKYRSKNYGLGTMSSRLTFTPVEDLVFTASAANYRMNGDGDDYSEDAMVSKNNTAYGLAASWRPAFFDRLKIWSQWVHGDNVAFFRKMDSDAVNYGLSFDLTEDLTVFIQGDFLRTKYTHDGANTRGIARALYTGVQYSLPYGVLLEAGWKHERVKWTDQGALTSKIKADTIYALTGFEF